MKPAQSKRPRLPDNRLCISCRRTCKQTAHAVVAQCPRYYPYNRKSPTPEFTWKQLELSL